MARQDFYTDPVKVQENEIKRKQENEQTWRNGQNR
jgi:hypothetical protein